MSNIRRGGLILVLVALFSAVPQALPSIHPAESSKSNPSDGTMRRIWVPILMYHYVSPLPPDPDDYRIGLTVEPDIFRTHIQYLHDTGYTTISLYQLHEALTNGAELPSKPVILTFDDGYLDHYTSVFPLLQEYRLTATFFIITGKADTQDPAYLSWQQISEMAAAGMDMESHTKTHSDLRARSFDFLVYEMLGSIESLNAHTGQLTRMFCYPAGRYDDNTLRILETLPIQRAVTTQHGAYQTTDNVLELPRLRITGNMSVAGLAQLINSSR